MKSPDFADIQPIRQVVLACICAMAIYGCSGSSDSGSGQIESSSELTADVANGNSGTSNDVSIATDMETVSEFPNAEIDSESTESGEPPVIAQPAPVITETSSLATIRVDFDITVPAYMSDELQLRLTWGDITTTAAWVQDENWAISETFPAGAENPLVVTFADRNGAITLGSFESTFRTGTGGSEIFQITADQFDTERWDSDADGISNLDELIAGTNAVGNDLLQPVQASLEFIPIKTFRITWQVTPDAQFYRVLENPDGISGFTDISGELEASTSNFDHVVALYSRVNAQYVVQSCNNQSCVDSEPVIVTGTLGSAIGYFKASNTDLRDLFGSSISLSADGNTMAIGAQWEDSIARGIDGNQNDNSASNSGAVYVFVRRENIWMQQAYLKASNTVSDIRLQTETRQDHFGAEVSLSSDGNTLAVAAPFEGVLSTGVNGSQFDSSSGIGLPGDKSGAVYVFTRTNDNWQQDAYIKASNTDMGDFFGRDSLALSGDGNTLVVGSASEDSAATEINGDQNDNSLQSSGAVYIFVNSQGTWQQQAYLKASNNSLRNFFGKAVSISADGNILAVGANGIGETDAGAVYIFTRTDSNWEQNDILIPVDLDEGDIFGSVLQLNDDGNTLVIGAAREDSAATGINGDPSDNSSERSGAAYIYHLVSQGWQQQAYLKASNAESGDLFGVQVSISADGNTVAIGASGEGGNAKGVNPNQMDNSSANSGAVYVFERNDEIWTQRSYLKASNTDSGDVFGIGVSLSAIGGTLAVGAQREESSASGINSDQTDNSAEQSGAVYIY